MPAYDSCTGETGNNAACLSAGSTCASAVESPIEEDNNFNVYDVLEPRSSESTDPPETYATYLTVRLRTEKDFPHVLSDACFALLWRPALVFSI